MSETTKTHELVKSQFGPVAAAYSTSVGHANSEALQMLVEQVQPRLTDRALDIATGAGHTAIAFAPYVTQVIAYDLTPQMLEETARNAAAKNISNLSTQEGLAEALPYADNSFEIVTCRVAPHHFADIKKAVAEMARVVKAGGQVAVVDTTAPEDETLDREINYIEKQRDSSHVRNYRPSEWKAMFEAENLQVIFLEQDFYTEQGRMNFATWTARMRTPEEKVRELAGLFRQASPALQAALEIEIRGELNEDIFFNLPKVTIIGRKAS